MTNSGGILIGVFTTSYDNLVAKPVPGDFLKYPISLQGVDEAFANNILMDNPGILVSSSDKADLQCVIALNVDNTGTLIFLGTMKKNTTEASTSCSTGIVHTTSMAHHTSVTSDSILKHIASDKFSGKRKPKSRLPQVFFGDKLLKPRAANDAAHAWIDHHGEGFAKIDLVHQRGIASTGNNFMRRFQVYRKNKWVTVKTMQECLDLVMEHSGRDFYADMKYSPEFYNLAFKSSQFVSKEDCSNAVSVIDDDENDAEDESKKMAKVESALFGSDSE